MPILPKQNLVDPTIELMKKTRESKVEPKRTYLGASQIGHACSRKLWYDLQPNITPLSSSHVGLWAADDGHESEAIAAERLKEVGVELYTISKDGNQFGFSDLNGKFKGHCDGLIAGGLLHAPKTRCVWEAKSCNQKKFDDFQRKKKEFGWEQVLKKWNEIYFIQAQIYMHYFSLDRHYTTVSLAGSRDMDSAWTHYEKEVAEQYIDRADRIIDVRIPPERISSKPDFFQCMMCNYREVCHG